MILNANLYIGIWFKGELCGLAICFGFCFFVDTVVFDLVFLLPKEAIHFLMIAFTVDIRFS